MDFRSIRFIQLRVVPLLRKNDFPTALLEIRKAMKNRSTTELKTMEISVLYGANNHDEAIRKGDEYLKNMRDSFDKASIAGFIAMIQNEAGNKDEENKYINVAIDIYKKIINNPECNYQEKNRARLQLAYEYRILGNYTKSLRVAKAMEKEFSGNDSADNLKALIPVYGELSNIYKALSDSLMAKHYPESYKKKKLLKPVKNKE